MGYELNSKKDLLYSIFQGLGFREGDFRPAPPVHQRASGARCSGLGTIQRPTLFRSIAGRLLYLGQLRPDMQKGIKEATRHFTAPTVGSFNAAVRLSRYLLGTRDYVMKLEPNDKHQLVVYIDSYRGRAAGHAAFDQWNT